MKKFFRKPILILVILLGLIIVLIIGYIAFGFFIEESYSTDTKIINQKIDINNTSNIFDMYFSVFPYIEKYVSNHQFVKTTLKIEEYDNEPKLTECVLYFFRLVDNIREGGTVSEKEIIINIPNDELISITTYFGAGRGMSGPDDPMDVEILKTAYDDAIEFANSCDGFSFETHYIKIECWKTFTTIYIKNKITEETDFIA